MANLEDEFGTRPATQEEFDAWNSQSIRGVRSVPSAVRVDSRGNRINEYRVIDDEFEISGPPEGVALQSVAHSKDCTCRVCTEKSFRYMNWHQKAHRHIPDPRCMICIKEQEFKRQHPELVGKRVGMQT